MCPRLVVCKCDPQWHAYAVCPRCEAVAERDELHRLLLKRGQVQPIVAPSYDALITASERRLDELDAQDRGWDAAQEHMEERS